jgi:hypothetical protein
MAARKRKPKLQQALERSGVAPDASVIDGEVEVSALGEVIENVLGEELAEIAARVGGEC